MVERDGNVRCSIIRVKMKDELSDLNVRLSFKTRPRRARIEGWIRLSISAAIMFIATALVLAAGLYDL